MSRGSTMSPAGCRGPTSSSRRCSRLVAGHGDRIMKEIEDPIIALVSLGEPRRFLLRPKGGGRSRPFMLGRGDLLVTGGKCQRTWEHSVPKVARAGPRISMAYRHDMDPAVY